MEKKDVNDTLMSITHITHSPRWPREGDILLFFCRKWAEGVNKGLTKKVALGLGFGDG